MYGPNLVRLLVPLHRGCDSGKCLGRLIPFCAGLFCGEHPFNAGACSHFSVDLAPGMHVEENEERVTVPLQQYL